MARQILNTRISSSKEFLEISNYLLATVNLLRFSQLKSRFLLHNLLSTKLPTEHKDILKQILIEGRDAIENCNLQYNTKNIRYFLFSSFYVPKLKAFTQLSFGVSATLLKFAHDIMVQNGQLSPESIFEVKELSLDGIATMSENEVLCSAKLFHPKNFASTLILLRQNQIALKLKGSYIEAVRIQLEGAKYTQQTHRTFISTYEEKRDLDQFKREYKTYYLQYLENQFGVEKMEDLDIKQILFLSTIPSNSPIFNNYSFDQLKKMPIFLMQILKNRTKKLTDNDLQVFYKKYNNYNNNQREYLKNHFHLFFILTNLKIFTSNKTIEIMLDKSFNNDFFKKLTNPENSNKLEKYVRSFKFLESLLTINIINKIVEMIHTNLLDELFETLSKFNKTKEGKKLRSAFIEFLLYYYANHLTVTNSSLSILQRKVDHGNRMRIR